jgi:hypothetical protein
MCYQMGTDGWHEVGVRLATSDLKLFLEVQGMIAKYVRSKAYPISYNQCLTVKSNMTNSNINESQRIRDQALAGTTNRR